MGTETSQGRSHMVHGRHTEGDAETEGVLLESVITKHAWTWRNFNHFFFLPEPRSSLVNRTGQDRVSCFLRGDTGSGAAARQGNTCCCSSFQPRRIQRGLPREKMNKGPRKHWGRDTAPLRVAGEPVSEPFGPFERRPTPRPVQLPGIISDQQPGT